MAANDTINSQKPDSDKQLHSGHRERLKERFLSTDGRDFTDHELLELLLFFVIPRVNTNELAHKLINEFGSLEGVFEADPLLLSRVSGAGKATSLFFSLHRAISKRIGMNKYDEKKFVADKLSKVGNYFCDYFKGSKSEEFCVMLLDNSLGFINFSSMSIGSVNSSSVDFRRVAKHALSMDASYVILAHNHPSGTLTESSDDRVITIQIEAALRAIGITLFEHIIVNDVAYAPTMHTRVKSQLCSKDVEKYRIFYGG